MEREQAGRCVTERQGERDGACLALAERRDGAPFEPSESRGVEHTEPRARLAARAERKLECGDDEMSGWQWLLCRE